MIYKKKVLFVLLLAVLIMTQLGSCSDFIDSGGSSGSTKKRDGVKIGFSMDTLVEERWQRDREIFTARAKELGADVVFQNANNNSEEQVKQVEYLMEEGIDVLVIVPHDADKSREIVEAAKKRGTRVIAYDRLIRNANVDMYISFDNVRVGELMAEHIMKKVPAGNYLIINGAPTDYNSYMYNQGYKSKLKASIDKTYIRLLKEIWAEDWKPEEAFKCVESVLQKGNKVGAVIAANDSLAGAAIEALSERRLSGKIPVVGHDADLAGCQRVVEGTQLMTVYKPIDRIAKTAAEMAVRMARKEEAKANSTINDGTYDIPYYKIQPIAVTRENIVDNVISDSFHSLDEVFSNVPKLNWPRHR
ncbi:MAG: substrate-binding domain-containing protein [Clostridia bacterium]|nr:substrate-binding domain-containing protein [Clostridia bacterium]